MPIQRALRLSVLDGALYAGMVGLSESYLGAFAVELGHRGTALALLATLPLLIGALAQLASTNVIHHLGSRKRLVTAGAAAQAVSHLGLAWIAHTEYSGLLGLLLCKVIFWSSGMVLAPAWGSWMASLASGVERHRYFAKRSAVVQLVLLVSFGWAGNHLQQGSASGDLSSSFVDLMLIALVARVGSTLAIAAQPDPLRPELPDRSEPRLRIALRRSHWRIAVYIAGLGFGAHIAVPFFTPYMLEELRLDYRSFALLTMLSIAAKAATFPLCDAMVRRIGLRNTLLWGGIGVALVPYLWTLDPSYFALLVINAAGGVVWAQVEYASFQLLLESADEEYHAEFLSLATSLTSLLQVLGSVAGGLLLEQLRFDYHDLFLASTLVRALPLALLVALPAALLPRHLPRLVVRILGVLPVSGLRLRLVVSPKAPPPGESPRSSTAGK